MLLMTKLKNAIKKELPDAEFDLKNININGCKRGCSGFIIYDNNIVYVNTEPVSQNAKLMYRYARNMHDYTGCRNQWSETGPDYNIYISTVINALKNRKAYTDAIT